MKKVLLLLLLLRIQICRAPVYESARARVCTSSLSLSLSLSPPARAQAQDGFLTLSLFLSLSLSLLLRPFPLNTVLLASQYGHSRFVFQSILMFPTRGHLNSTSLRSAGRPPLCQSRNKGCFRACRVLQSRPVPCNVEQRRAINRIERRSCHFLRVSCRSPKRTCSGHHCS